MLDVTKELSQRAHDKINEALGKVKPNAIVMSSKPYKTNKGDVVKGSFVGTTNTKAKNGAKIKWSLGLLSQARNLTPRFEGVIVKESKYIKDQELLKALPTVYTDADGIPE